MNATKESSNRTGRLRQSRRGVMDSLSIVFLAVLGIVALVVFLVAITFILPLILIGLGVFLIVRLKAPAAIGVGILLVIGGLVDLLLVTLLGGGLVL